MKIYVDANYVSIVSKMNKLASSDIGNFNAQLEKIRVGIAGAYKSNTDITEGLSYYEKQISAFSNKLTSLSAAFNQAASDILTSSNKAVNVGELTPLSKELGFILSSPSAEQIEKRNEQILLARQLSEKLRDSTLLTSPLTKGVVSSVFTAASSVALLSILNSDSSAEGIDSWFKEYYPDEYKATLINDEMNRGVSQGYSGPCIYAAKANMLNRKYMLDNLDTSHKITTKQITDHYEKVGHKKAYNEGNQFSDISEYSNYNLKRMGVNSSNAQSTVNEFLDNKPEGITVWSDKVGHAILITDYEMVDGKRQYYVIDPAKMKNDNNDRKPLEDCWMYTSSNCKSAEDFFSKINYIHYID